VWEVILNQESSPKQLAGMTVSGLAAKPTLIASAQEGGPCLDRRTSTSHGFSHSPPRAVSRGGSDGLLSYFLNMSSTRAVVTTAAMAAVASLPDQAGKPGRTPLRILTRATFNDCLLSDSGHVLARD
jgi:hypothetical protein